jgi:hypothetical protein
VIGHDNILNSTKEVIRQDPSVPLKRVYDSVNRHHVRRGGGDREHIPEFHRIRNSMTRSRLEHVPEVPHSIDDISIHGPWERSWSHDRFLLQQDNEWGMFYMPQMTISKTSENALTFTLTAPFAHALTHMNNISPYMVNTETEFCALLTV